MQGSFHQTDGGSPESQEALLRQGHAGAVSGVNEAKQLNDEIRVKSDAQNLAPVSMLACTAGAKADPEVTAVQAIRLLSTEGVVGTGGFKNTGFEDPGRSDIDIDIVAASGHLELGPNSGSLDFEPS